MRIIVLDQPAQEVVARDEPLGGEFFTRDGSVYYRHPLDDRLWFVNHDVNKFRKCAQAWNQYQERVAVEAGEDAQLAIVEALRNDLAALGALHEQEHSLWSVLFEQAENEML